MAGIVLENVSRIFPGPVQAVERLNLEVLDHEFLVLVGPSGCGKSTILRMVAGLERPTSGEIRIGGVRVNETPPQRRNIAMTFQNSALHPQLSVRGNLTLGWELRHAGRWRQIWRRPATGAQQTDDGGLERGEIAEEVRKTARILGIEGLLERLPRELSGGERQRVALGRAIVRRPVAFLFDEPLSNLDAHLRVQMRQTLKQLHQRLATTTVLVTHDQVEALSLGQRIAVLNAGGLQQVGTLQEVYDWPKNRFVAGFIGTPPMSFLIGELVRSGSATHFRRGNRWLPLSSQAAWQVQHCIGREVVLGLRPDDVTLTGTPGSEPLMLCARVSLVEPLGDASIVSLSVADLSESADSERWELAAKVAPATRMRVGEETGIKIDWQRVHWFDASTNENLFVGKEPAC